MFFPDSLSSSSRSSPSAALPAGFREKKKRLPPTRRGTDRSLYGFLHENIRPPGPISFGFQSVSAPIPTLTTERPTGRTEGRPTEFTAAGRDLWRMNGAFRRAARCSGSITGGSITEQKVDGRGDGSAGFKSEIPE